MTNCCLYRVPIHLLRHPIRAIHSVLQVNLVNDQSCFLRDWNQVIGPSGYPTIYITLGHNKPVMRTYQVDSGTVWTTAACAVDQVREPCERHNVDVAALKENKRGFDVTPEFLAHLTFNHCGDSVMKLMGRHPELYNLSLGTRDSIGGQAKHCLGCMIANMRLGARAM